MPENLMNAAHKASTAAYRDGWARVFEQKAPEGPYYGDATRIFRGSRLPRYRPSAWERVKTAVSLILDAFGL